MPAQSVKQARLMRIVRGIQKGDIKPSDASKTAKGLAKSMKPSDVEDFAKTPDKGLPQQAESKGSVREAVMSTLNLLAKETDDFNEFLQKFKVEYPKIKLDNPTIQKLKRMFNGDKRLKEVGKINEGLLNKQVKQFLDNKMSNLPKGKPNHLWAVMHVLGAALTDANFHPEAKNVPKLFPTANWGDPSQEDEFAKVYSKFGRQIAEMCKWDGGDIVDAIGFYVSMTIGRPLGQRIEKLVEGVVNENDSPCWKGYQQVGMKMKNGKEVPNCVPVNEEEDCGCGNVNEYPVHSSNRLYLKTAMNNL